MSFDRVDEIAGDNLPADPFRKGFIVDEPDALFYPDRVAQAVVRNLGHADSEIGYDLVGAREILVAVECVVDVDGDDVRIDCIGLNRIDIGR